MAHRPHPMWVRPKDAKPDSRWRRTPNWWTQNTEIDPYEGMDKVFQGQRAIDVTGLEVFVGDRIAVAVTVSRSANMRVGVVTDIVEILEDDWSADWSGKSRPKKGTGRYRIKCDWEASGWDQGVKSSSIEAGLPKYVKLPA